MQSFKGASVSTGTVSVTTTAATTHGNLLVAVVSISATSNITVSAAPAATAETGYNSTWTPITSSTQNSGNRCYIAMYYIENAAAQPSGTVQSFTLSGTATAATVSISEYRGAKTSGSLRASNAISSGQTTSQGTNPVTSQSADVDGIYVAAVAKASNVNWTTATNGFGLRASSLATTGAALSAIVLDRQVTSAASTSTVVSTTLSSGVIGSGCIAVFTPAAVTAKYWVGNGSNTDCTAAANWSTWSGGAAFSAPTSTMDVYFDGNGTGSCTLSAATTWNSLTIGAAYTGTLTVGANLTLSDATKVATVGGGTLAAGAATLTFKGGLTVSAGALNLTSTGTIAIGSGKSLTIDGTLQATDSTTVPTIQVDSSGTYTFTVGSSSSATPVLNLDGLNVKNTDSNGMNINAVAGSTTTFTRFDKIAFASGTGTQLLQIYAATLNLASNGCTFDAGATTGTTTYAVQLTGDGTGNTRAIFGGTTCANNWTADSSDRACLTVASGSGTSAKLDGDSAGTGIGTSTVNGGAVVQFVRAAGTDTAGTLVGFPTAAFDWNTFNDYSTYVAYNSASGTSPILYVRDGSGTAKYSWTFSAGETIVGIPQWITTGTTHYVYVAMASGKIYRLVDDASSSLTLDTSWATNPYDCSCAITTPLSADSSNLYWGGTQSSSQKLWTLGQSSESQPTGSPFTVTPTITSAAPLAWTMSGTTYLFFGTTGHLLEFDATNQVLAADNTSPGTASVWGRIAPGSGTTKRIFAGDDAGNFWSIDPTTSNFAGTNKQWSYTVTGSTMKSSPYYDLSTDTVMFGTESGQVVALTSAGAPLTGYPYVPGSSADAIRSAPLYYSGVLAAGTTTGKLYFIDRDNGTTGPALIRQYTFGTGESVSGISFDPTTSRYMVATSSATAKDGRLYYIDALSDPTPSAP